MINPIINPDTEAWDDVKWWMDVDDLIDEIETAADPNTCQKCGRKMKPLNTGLRNNIYACPVCEKVR